MTGMFGILCRSLGKEYDLFSLTEKVCIKYHTEMYIKEFFVSALFVVAKNKIQYECLWVEKWLNK